MNSFWNNHGTKILGWFTTTLGTIGTLLLTGAFNGLLEDTSIRWLTIIVAVLTGGTGVATVQRGNVNTAQIKVADAITTALNAPPPSQGGFARPLMLALLLAVAVPVLMLSACQTPPHKVIDTACTPGTRYSVERCVKGIAETWEVYQIRAEIIVADPLTPADVKAGVQRAEAASRPVVVDTLKAGAVYADIKQQVAAGQTDAERLAIANANLERWVAKALPLVRNFGRQLDR